MRGIWIAMAIGLTSIASGCASPGGDAGGAAAGSGVREAPASIAAATGAEAESLDGLRERKVEIPGVLLVRQDHGIGTYDAFLIPAATISYERRSVQLPIQLEDEFLAVLEQSLIDAATDAEIEIEEEPGTCVLQVQMRLEDVSISRRASNEGSMTLVMELSDTLSRQSLLRYSAQQAIPSANEGGTRTERIRASFDEMVGEMEISGALRAAGLGAAERRPPCEGLLAKRGQSGLPAVSAK